VAFPGLSINGFTNSANAGIVFATLKPFEERKGAGAEPASPSPWRSTAVFGIQDAFIACSRRRR
jgi:multidrug efflux pump